MAAMRWIADIGTLSDLCNENRMHKLRLPIICCTLLGAVVHIPSAAQPTSQSAVPPDLKQAILNWSECRATKVRERVNTRATGEDVVDQAMTECAAVESRAMQLWEKHYGVGSKRQLIAIRAKWRAGLIEGVNNVRTGTPLTDPYHIWGRCIGDYVNASKVNNNPEAIADAALLACAPKQQSVQVTIASQFGGAKATEQIKVLRSEMRKMAIAIQRH